MSRLRAIPLTLAAASLALSACSDPSETQNAVEASAEESGELAKRLAFMAGHVEAGIALYRAGESEAGGPHLLHPVSEAYAEEREGLDQLGFDPAPFEAVSAALEAGRPANEIEPQLEAVEANLATMREKAGGQPDELIVYLMQLAVEEYRIGVKDGTITDAGEYQDAWGFAVVARQLAEQLPAPTAGAVSEELDTLIALWPEAAPTVGDDPASVDAVIAQAAKVNSIFLEK